MPSPFGGGSGATFALIAKVTEPSRVGGVTGLVGAAGGLGGFAPPLVMGYVYGRTDSYAIGLWLLAVTAGLTLLLTLTVVRHTERAHDEPDDDGRDDSTDGHDVLPRVSFPSGDAAETSQRVGGCCRCGPPVCGC